MFANNKYNMLYEDFINKRKNRKPFNGDFYEEHHIIPKSLGGDNNRNNLVKLTPREHFFAHLLLAKITEGSDQIQMSHALKFMSDVDGTNRTLNSRQYEIAKQIRYSILKSAGKSYQHEKNLQNSVITEYTDINKVFERGTCKQCGVRPRAINYIRNNRTYYRTQCDTCIEGKNQFKIPEWKIKGYEKKNLCENCGFTAKYTEQLTVTKKDRSYKTVCLNCQIELMLASQIPKKGLVADF